MPDNAMFCKPIDIDKTCLLLRDCFSHIQGL